MRSADIDGQKSFPTVRKKSYGLDRRARTYVINWKDMTRHIVWARAMELPAQIKYDVSGEVDAGPIGISISSYET